MNSSKVDNYSFSHIREAITIFHQQCRFPLSLAWHVEPRMVKDHIWRYKPQYSIAQLTKFWGIWRVSQLAKVKFWALWFFIFLRRNSEEFWHQVLGACFGQFIWPQCPVELVALFTGSTRVGAFPKPITQDRCSTGFWNIVLLLCNISWTRSKERVMFLNIMTIIKVLQYWAPFI